MNSILADQLKEKVVIFDGAMGTELYNKNFFVNASYENLCLSAPNVVSEVHQSYKDAGAVVLTTNSFGANFNKLNKFGLGDRVAEINRASVRLARKVAGHDLMVAASVGPVGTLPEGEELSEEKLFSILFEQVSVLASENPDFIIFETLSTLPDLLRALRTMNELSYEFPFVISIMPDEDGNLSDDGTEFEKVKDFIEKSPVQPVAVGLNCGLGPDRMLSVVEKVRGKVKLPIIVQPNAGAPKRVDDRTIYMCSAEYFTTYAMRFVSLGVRGVGGCCGTTPASIRDMARSIDPLSRIEAHSHIFAKETEEASLEPLPPEKRSSFARKLVSGEFVKNVEMVPPQGFDLSQTIEKAKYCRTAGFDAVNIPDGPRASSRVSTLVTAYKIQQEAGIETILHQCCRDKNLIGMQAELLGCAALNVANILFITGDPPKLGAYPFASGVFDVDSIGMLKLQTRLNRGLDLAGKSMGMNTNAFYGAGADPNAIDMAREIRRTREKISAGASFIITQPVFDVDALLRFMDSVPELDKVPLIAGIWPFASLRNAEFMKSEVPGVVVPDSLLVRMGKAKTKEAQREEGIAIAREALAALKGSIAGVQVSAPFGNVQTASAVIS